MMVLNLKATSSDASKTRSKMHFKSAFLIGFRACGGGNAPLSGPTSDANWSLSSLPLGDLFEIMLRLMPHVSPG